MRMMMMEKRGVLRRPAFGVRLVGSSATPTKQTAPTWKGDWRSARSETWPHPAIFHVAVRMSRTQTSAHTPAVRRALRPMLQCSAAQPFRKQHQRERHAPSAAHVAQAVTEVSDVTEVQNCQKSSSRGSGVEWLSRVLKCRRCCCRWSGSAEVSGGGERKCPIKSLQTFMASSIFKVTSLIAFQVTSRWPLYVRWKTCQSRQ